ncbi:pol polyprotein [Apostichopus japonicus]|uniref:Pol polyprotein n=1 Tax=Stichopus japonicus TaxID=307972 RepID=A0A2G8JHK8_STIJA|nr:pol polyprotein [Apostichopus japonicus]
MSLTASSPKVILSPQGHVGSMQINCKQQKMSSITCCNSASYARPPVIGRRHYTLSRRNLETGALAAITGLLITLRCPTNIQYHTYRISQTYWQGNRYFQPLTSSVLITKYQSNQKTYQKPNHNPFGLYEFVRMPFGLRNAAQTFQRFIDQVLRGLPFVFTYIDDLLIASNTKEEHEQHLRAIFERLQDHGVVINPTKCVFGADSVDFLGHHVTSQGISALPEKVTAIQAFTEPTTLKQLREFLGMFNFYRRFVPHCADLLLPLTDMLKGERKNAKITLNDAQQKAFSQAKETLAKTTLLTHPRADAPIHVSTDASDFAVGGVLHQTIEGQQQPIASFSKKLQPAETRYSTFSRELLAIYLTIRHFRHYLEGRTFFVLTDHKPLTFALQAKPDKHSPREIRQLDFISQYTTDIRHIKGTENLVADALSRSRLEHISTSSIPTTVVDTDNIALTQTTDDELESLRKSSSLQFLDVPIPMTERTIACDISTGIPRPYIPQSYRRQVFDSVHSLAHPGTRATRTLIKKRYVWPSMNHDIAKWTRQCARCQQVKVHRHTKPVLSTIPPANALSSNCI